MRTRERLKKTKRIKQYLLVLAMALVILTGVALASFSAFVEYATNQLAAVLRLQPHEIYDFQRHHGIAEDVQFGDAGDDVVLVQRALRALRPDFPADNITGYYGKDTEEAVRAYQVETGLPATGVTDAATREKFNRMYMQELCPGAIPKTYKDEILVKVNRSTPLPAAYVPSDLIDISELVKTTQVMCLKEEAAVHLQDLMADAEADGISLAVTSGFRRSEVQGVLYTVWKFFEGDRAGESVALPAHSEHQLGTAVDFAAKTNANRAVDRNFAHTPEFGWLREHAYRYGFVLSYPEDKESVTTYEYEPWHWRYLGLKAAKEIQKEEMSVEEYFASHNLSTVKKSKRK